MTRKQTRRELLIGAGLGAGGLALGSLLPGGAFASQAADGYVDPLAPRQPHFPAKVKSVIWLHMAGAPSTLDLFDYKPQLIKLHGQPLPESFSKGLKTATDGGVGALTATPRTWKQYGETGAWVSDLLPNIAKHVDNISFLKGCKTEGSTHVISSLKLHTECVDPGASVARRVDHLRSRQCESGPAGVRRPAHGQGWSGRRQRPGDLERRLPSRDLPGNLVPPG
jgi:hypothetical protein